MPEMTRGPLALVGGGEWIGDDAIDRALVERGGHEVLVIPTAAAYEDPEAVVAMAAARYSELGAKVVSAMVLSRSDAEDARNAEQIRAAQFIYLAGGSPLHLRVTLKDSAVLRALFAAWYDGALVAGSSAGAMALSDPMIDPRGGAFTTGLGLVRDLAVVPHFTGGRDLQLDRTLALATDGCAVVALSPSTGVICETDGTWIEVGPGPIAVYVDQRNVGLSALAGKRFG